jgi:hypothetical protein
MEDINKSDSSLDSGFGLDGKYMARVIRKGEVIDEFQFDNIIVNEGLTHALETELGNGTQVGIWYVGLFKGNYTPLATDTAANIATNSTEATEYTEANRVTYVPSAAAAQSITNAASVAEFNINATVTIYGAFLVSTNTKSGTGGVLFSAARFPAQRDLQNTDLLQITYQVDASDV